MKQIIKILILFCVLPVYGQQTDFSQIIERNVGYITVDKNVKNVFIYIDTTYPKSKITVHGPQTTQNFAKMRNDTLIISKPNNKTPQKQPIISIYLNKIPKGIDVLSNGGCVFIVMQNMVSQKFNITAKENAEISFCVIYEWIFDTLTVYQERKSEIYFSELSVNRNLFIKSDNATFIANDENIKNGIKTTILSHNSSIKIKGFTAK